LDHQAAGIITRIGGQPGAIVLSGYHSPAALPAAAGTSMTLGRAVHKTHRVKVHDNPAAQLSAYPRPIRQSAVTGPGHDQPTLLITNRFQIPARQIIRSYARRVNIEQRLAGSPRVVSTPDPTGG
jgi:hypothetical protein